MKMKPQTKIPLLLVQEGDGTLEILEKYVQSVAYGDPKMNWELVRERDGLTKRSNDVIWLEWNNEGRFKEKHSEPAVGRSLLMSPFNDFFTWQTTSVTEIVEQREDYIKFKTQNSNYELYKI